MKIIKPYHEILTEFNGTDVLKHIEQCGRVCYKSEHRITDDSHLTFIKNIIKRGHEAVLEHFSFSVKFVCDRGVTHEIVRHRLASYCQESQRYVNYSKDDFGGEICVIEPSYLTKGSMGYGRWVNACIECEKAYFDLLDWGATPQEARAVLPNSTKTEIIMTANLREWRHFFKLRCSKAAHPQMRELVIPLLKELQTKLPVIFDDIEV